MPGVVREIKKRLKKDFTLRVPMCFLKKFSQLGEAVWPAIANNKYRNISEKLYYKNSPINMKYMNMIVYEGSSVSHSYLLY